MAEATEQEKILNIRVNYAEAVKGLTEYAAKIQEAKQKQKELDEQLDAGTISAEEYAEGMATAQNAVKVYEGNVRSLNKEIQNNIKEQQAQDGSLVQLRAQLSNLTKAYDSLSATERESGKQGEQLRNSINEVTTKLKAAEEATQRYYRNVGNYENAIKNTLGTQSQWFKQLESLSALMQGGLTNALKATGTAVANVGKQFLALLANPIVATIAAIVAVFLTLQKALKSNEEGTRALQRVMAPLEATFNIVINAVQELAQWVINLVEGAEMLALGLSKLLEKLPLVGNAIGAVNAKLEENIALTREKQALEDEVRKTEIENAEAARDVAKLRNEAAQLSDPVERAKKLKEAIAIEGEQLNRELAIAQKRYELAEREAAQTKNSKEQNDKLVQARADLARAEEKYYTGTMRMQSQLRSADEQMAREAAANQKAMTEATKKEAEERAKIVAEQKQKERDAIRQAEDALIAIIRDNYERQRAQTEAAFDRQIEDLKKRLATEKNLTETAQQELTITIQALYQQRADAIAAIEKQASEERLNQAIADEQKRLQLIIDTTNKGSQAQYDARMALLQQQQDAATAEIEQSALTEQQKQERIDLVRQQYEQQRTELRVEQNELEMQAAQEAFEQRIAQETENALEASRLEYEQKKAALDTLHQMEGESNDAFRARELAATKAFTESKKKYDQMQAQSEQAKLQVTAAVFGGMSKIMDAFGEESKEAAIASKVLALAQIAVSTGLAIAQGVQQAQSVPYPGNIVAIATTVATVLANIASAITTVKGAKFAEGGLVTGEGTGTSDSIPAQLSNGESVMTAQATSMFAPLLSTLNQIGGGVPIVTPSPTVTTPSAGDEGSGSELLTEAFREAIKDMPRPVVAVSEINDVQGRVEVIEQLAAQ